MVEIDGADSTQMVIVSTYNFLFLDVEKFNKAILITNGEAFKSPFDAAYTTLGNFLSLVAFATPDIGDVA